MRRVRSLAVVTSALCLSAMAIAPAASAGDVSANLAGRWKSAALKMDGAGYKMALIPTETEGIYDAKIRFIYQDGKRGSLIRAEVSLHGRTAGMKFTGGSGESVTVPGTLGDDGSLNFPTCYQVIPLIKKSEAPAACLFQEVPTRR